MKILIQYRTSAVYLETPVDIPRATRVLGFELTMTHELHLYFDEGIKFIYLLPVNTASYRVTCSNE